MFKVFYSWQSDLPNRTNRGLIETALKKASESLRSSDGVLAEAVVDRDTLGLPGSPSINEAILEKIRDCDAFVADVSIINSVVRPSTHAGIQGYLRRALNGLAGLPTGNFTSARPCPNPNVLIELGYAMAHLGNEAIVLVVNAHYGELDALPFDLRPLRKLQYRAGPDHDMGSLRKELARDFENALKGIAAFAKADPVDAILYERTLQVAGAAQGLLNHLARATGLVDNTVTEAQLIRFFDELTEEQIHAICSTVDPNAAAPLVLSGPMGRNATWLELLKYYRRRSASFTSKILVFSPFLKREHAALLMRVEQCAHFMLLDLQTTPVSNTTLEWLGRSLWEYFQFALRLKQYARRELARRAGPL